MQFDDARSESGALQRQIVIRNIKGNYSYIRTEEKMKSCEEENVQVKDSNAKKKKWKTSSGGVSGSDLIRACVGAE